jgi:hypothetical protein
VALTILQELSPALCDRMRSMAAASGKSPLSASQLNELTECIKLFLLAYTLAPAEHRTTLPSSIIAVEEYLIQQCVRVAGGQLVPLLVPLLVAFLRDDAVSGAGRGSGATASASELAAQFLLHLATNSTAEFRAAVRSLSLSLSLWSFDD